jgi:hypothetical protein
MDLGHLACTGINVLLMSYSLLDCVPCKSKTDIWNCLNNGIKEYVALYVEDLLIDSQVPSSATKAINDHHQT